jgi:hypothetical protein
MRAALQFGGNESKFDARDVQQETYVSANGIPVRGGYEFAVGSHAKFSGLGQNPGGIGAGDIVSNPETANAETRLLVHHPAGVFPAEFDVGIVPFELRTPVGPLGKQIEIVAAAVPSSR